MRPAAQRPLSSGLLWLLLLLLAATSPVQRASAVAVVLYKNTACVDATSVENLYAALTALGYSVTNVTAQPALNAATQVVSSSTGRITTRTCTLGLQPAPVSER